MIHREPIGEGAVSVYGGQDGSDGYVRYTDMRVPTDHLVGDRGGAFASGNELK